MTGEEIDARRLLCKPLLEYACDGGKVDEDHAHYTAVTERRDVGAMRAKYSSCGDLAHWLFYRVGVRSSFVNRAEHKTPPGKGWRVGQNVSLLAALTGAAKVADAESFNPELGDVLIVWNSATGTDAHVICVLDFDRELGLLTTAEYGQPGGAIKTYEIKPPMFIREKRTPDGQKIFEACRDPDQRPFLGKRRVQRHIRFADVLLRASLAGELADPSLPWETR
jgi:hypothetical protein